MQRLLKKPLCGGTRTARTRAAQGSAVFVFEVLKFSQGFHPLFISRNGVFPDTLGFAHRPASVCEIGRLRFLLGVKKGEARSLCSFVGERMPLSDRGTSDHWEGSSEGLGPRERAFLRWAGKNWAESTGNGMNDGSPAHGPGAHVTQRQQRGLRMLSTRHARLTAHARQVSAHSKRHPLLSV